MLSGKVLFISAGKFTTRNYPDGGDGRLAYDVQSSPCVYPRRGLKPRLATLAALHGQQGHGNRSQDGRQRCWRGVPPSPATAPVPQRPQQHILSKVAAPASPQGPRPCTPSAPPPPMSPLGQGGRSTLGPQATGELLFPTLENLPNSEDRKHTENPLQTPCRPSAPAPTGQAPRGPDSWLTRASPQTEEGRRVVSVFRTH